MMYPGLLLVLELCWNKCCAGISVSLQLESYMTGSGKKAQADRAKNCLCLCIDTLSLHIPLFIPELCALETQSFEIAVLRNAHLKDC